MKREPRKIEMNTVCNLSELAAFLGIARRTIYDQQRLKTDPYTLQYPRIGKKGKTTPAHYLQWASKAPVTAKEESDASRRERQKQLLRSGSSKASPTAGTGRREEAPQAGTKGRGRR